MKFNKKLKKGFTLVELIVVIAIVAILAAVSVVSYIAFINSANESADVQLVKQLNIALQADQSLNGPRDTMHEMLGAMEENGFVVENLTKTKSGYDIVWDQEHNRFALLNGENLVYGESTYYSAKAWNIWKFADTEDEAKNKSYSVYLTEAFGNAKSLNVSSGLDVGNNVISTINYNDAGHPQTVVIRTNSFKTDIDINESTGDTIKHYGIANKLTTTRLTTNSYHEYGKLIIAFITEGRVVAEDKGVIEIAYVSSETAYAQEKDSGVINLAYASSLTVKTASDTPDTVNGVKKELIYETSVTAETVGNIVARIGLKGYSTLAAAISAAKDGDVVAILKDVTTSSNIIFAKSITIDGNDHTLTSTQANPRALYITLGQYSVASNLDLTIKNFNLVMATTNGSKSENRGIVTYGVKDSNITLENVNVSANYNDYTYAVKFIQTSNTVLNIKNSNLTGANAFEDAECSNNTYNFEATVFNSIYPNRNDDNVGHGVVSKHNSNVINLTNCTFEGEYNAIPYAVAEGTVVNEIGTIDNTVCPNGRVMINSWNGISVNLMVNNYHDSLVTAFNNRGNDCSIEITLYNNVVESKKDYDYKIAHNVNVTINTNGFTFTPYSAE